MIGDCVDEKAPKELDCLGGEESMEIDDVLHELARAHLVEVLIARLECRFCRLLVESPHLCVVLSADATVLLG